ncbi:MAG TPA: TonB-dependent receptor, partial [Bacteroidales bacterium]
MKKISFLCFFLFSICYSVQSQTLTQTIKGKLYDAESQSAVEGAYVHIQNSNPQIGSISDVDGSYKIANVAVGRYNIVVSLVGYEPVVIPEVLVTSGKEVVLDIPMKQQVTEMKEVTVKAFSRKDKPLNTMASVSARAFTVEETRRYAGGFDDPARLASSFAGVTVGNVQNNAIIIRGNSPKGVAWRLEGVDIPNPNHFAGANVAGGGAVTAFSSQMLDNSDFYTGAFPSEYGNAMAGVFDMKLRNGNNEKYEHTFQAGTMGIDFASEGPLGKIGGASYLFNYRYSTLGFLTKTKIVNTDEIIAYQDLSLKINIPTTRAGTFSFWGIGSYDEDTKPEEYDSASWEFESDRQNFKWTQGMGAAGISHKINLGNAFYLKSTLSGNTLIGDFDIDRLDDNLAQAPYMNFVNESSKVTFSSTLNGKLSAKWTLRTGFVANQLYYNLNLKSLIDDVPDTYQPLLDDANNSGYYQYFISAKYDVTSNLSINGGLHALYFAMTEKSSIEPRVGLRWAVAEDHDISLGYGLHSQMEELRVYCLKQNVNGNIVTPNKDLDFGKAHHFVMAYDWRINNNLRLKIEPYFQYLFDAPGIKDSSYSMINFSQEWAFHY